jgi:F-type H+-transporting ATPase subunit b
MSAGIPHLDMTLFAPQIFWAVLLFALFFGVVLLFFIPVIRDIQLKRQALLATDLLASKRLREELLRHQSQSDAVLHEAQAKATSIIGEALQAAQARADAASQSLASTIGARWQVAQRDMQDSIAALQLQLDSVATDIESLVSQKLGVG